MRAVVGVAVVDWRGADDRGAAAASQIGGMPMAVRIICVKLPRALRGLVRLFAKKEK